MNLYILALHIIFVVTWFAGLFYIVRLFVYHSEAEKKTEPEKFILQRQYKIMEKRLWYGIAWPSMIGTYLFGLWLFFSNFSYYFSSLWFILKLCFVFGLTLYHIQCHAMFRNYQQNVVKYSPIKMRLWNEVATVFLVAIVFIVVLKDTFSYVWGMLGLVLFTAAIYAAIRIYKNIREKRNKNF